MKMHKFIMTVVVTALCGALWAGNAGFSINWGCSSYWDCAGVDESDGYVCDIIKDHFNMQFEVESSGSFVFYIKGPDTKCNVYCEIFSFDKYMRFSKLSCSSSWTGYSIPVTAGETLSVEFDNWMYDSSGVYIRFTSPGAGVSMNTYVSDRLIGGAKYDYWNRNGRAEAVSCKLIQNVNGEFVFPNVVDGLSVYSIDSLLPGEDAYAKGMTSIVIPEGVVEIGDGALADFDFGRFDSVQKITLPESLRKIGTDAFYECHGLTSIVIPDGVTEIGTCAFRWCTGLTSITLPTSLNIFCYDEPYSRRIQYLFSEDGEESDFDGNVPFYGRLKEIHMHGDALDWTLQMTQLPGDCTICVQKGTTGWGKVPGVWHGMPTRYDIALDPKWMDEIKGGLDCSVATTFKGFVLDAAGVQCGLVSVTAGKATKKGVKISGYLMLDDGKKYTIKAVTSVGEDGRFVISSTAGKLGNLTLVVGANGFAGSVGSLRVSSDDIGEGVGVISGNIKMKYFDMKTGKIKTKSIKLSGMAVDGEAFGSLSRKKKGVDSERFEAVYK